MAKKELTEVKETTEVVTFTKEQIMKSNTFKKHRDLLSVMLNDKKTYSKEQVNKMISKFYGKGKGE